MIETPRFKPQQWVTFKVGNGYSFGQIMGGSYDGTKDEWMYFATNAPTAGSTYTVLHSDIVYLLKDDTWTAI